jgi:hypothetical protein
MSLSWRKTSEWMDRYKVSQLGALVALAYLLLVILVTWFAFSLSLVLLAWGTRRS